MTQVAKIEEGQAAPADPMVQMIERIVLSPDIPMERISAMIDIRERQMAKEAEQAFNAAFAQAMAEMPDVPKSGKNAHLKRRYSTLDDLIRTARPVLARHGLSLNWQASEESDRIKVRAIVRHADGHSIDTELGGPRDKSGSMNVLQGGGSTETYLKRYTGFAILGMSSGDEQDDDGRGGADRGATITDDQLKELKAKIEEVGLDEGVILTAEKLPDLTTLPAADFQRVMSKLSKSGKAK